MRNGRARCAFAEPIRGRVTGRLEGPSGVSSTGRHHPKRHDGLSEARQEVADDLDVPRPLLPHREVGAVLEHDELRAPNAPVDALRHGGRHLVVLPTVIKDGSRISGSRSVMSQSRIVPMIVNSFGPFIVWYTGVLSCSNVCRTSWAIRGAGTSAAGRTPAPPRGTSGSRGLRGPRTTG